MTTTHTNEPAKPATVTQVMARFVLLANWNNLAEPILAQANSRSGAIIEVATREDVKKWLVALGAAEPRIASADHQGGQLFWGMAHDWHGWSVTIQAHEMPTPAAELDAETMADLIQVAAAMAPDAEPTLWRTYTGAEYDSVTKIPCATIANGYLMDVKGDPIHEDHPEIGAEIERRGQAVFVDHAYAKVPVFGCDHSETALAEPTPSVDYGQDVSVCEFCGNPDPLRWHPMGCGQAEECYAAWAAIGEPASGSEPRMPEGAVSA